MSIEEHNNFYCPYCGQANLLEVDITGGGNQHFVVDCEVCCAPIAICLRIQEGAVSSMEARKENE